MTQVGGDGTPLGGRYQLGERLGSGGMADVYHAEDLLLHRPVAVKVLRSEYTADETFVARFRAEARHAASLSHPNIAAVFDYGEEIAQDGTGETLAYLVMELIEGEPLSALLRREGPLDTATTLSLLRQIAFALAEAHRAGLVHRDVKPGNILVCPDGSVKITDFGIAWSARSVALTRTGQVIGTPQYLSPEQAEGRPATPASDVYALGLIGYECLAGRPAFDGDNAVTIALKQVRQEPDPLPDVLPVSVRGLIARSLAKDPAVRLPDGAAVVSAIEDIAAGRAVPPPPTVSVAAVAGGTAVVGSGHAAVSRPPAPRRRGRITMVLLPLLGVLAGAGIAAVLLQALAHGRPPATAQAAEQRDTSGIVLSANDYVGRPVDDVAGQLAAYGLAVLRRVDPSADAAPGMVTRVDPVGTRLHRGDPVTVFFAPARSTGAGTVDTGRGVTETALTASAGATDGAATTHSGRSAAPTTTTAPEPSTLPGSPTETGAPPSSSDSGTPPSSSASDSPPPSSDPGTPPSSSDSDSSSSSESPGSP
ncbi:MAG: pknA2 [Blastococcus sp.]|nr:pknA2 [Blastococcus sp.]